MKNKQSIRERILYIIVFAIFLNLINAFITKNGAGIFFIAVLTILIITAIIIIMEVKKTKKK